MSAKKRTFRIAFPVYATSFDRIDLKPEEVPEDKEELKQLLYNKAHIDHPCHQCSDTLEVCDAVEYDSDMIDVYEETEEEE